MTAHTKSLRERLLDELSEHHRDGHGWPTWWWAHSKRKGDSTVTQAREELKRMEKEGLVKRLGWSQSNNIIWTRVEAE